MKTDFGLTIIKNKKFSDSRGCFIESWNKEKYKELINFDFVQDNLSFSKKNVLRGLHYQTGFSAQGKLIRVIDGEIYDVAVDINQLSPTYGHWEANILDINTQAFIPIGFAHGFCVLSKTATVLYKVTNYYNKSAERTIIWNDRQLNIDWPIKRPILSAKDKRGIAFKDIWNTSGN